MLSGKEALPVALTRAGQAVLPSTNSRLESGDVVHLSATMEGIEALKARLAQPEGE
jgi:hypothetical protein